MSPEAERSYLVIGGAGFLGSHIVDAFVSRGDRSVAVFDLVEPAGDGRADSVKYYTGDIGDESRLLEVLKEFNPTVVIHTASPVHGLPPDIYYKVNENGTRVVISACQKAGIKKLVYTSSTGVVWTGEGFNGITEDEAKIPAKGFDAYHHTKALGERLILKENGVNGMRTVALRPCGMTGERDKQLIWRLAKVLKDGRQNVQIGDNTNLVDYLYAGNAAYAHVLAADRLYDKPDLVAGQAFFITNGSPVLQWNFMRMVWKELGDDGKKSIVKIHRIVGLVMAILSELWSYVTGASTEFTRFSVRFATGTQWYSIEKARSILGYEPKVSLEEGVRRTVQWWNKTGAREHAESLAIGKKHA